MMRSRNYAIVYDTSQKTIRRGKMRTLLKGLLLGLLLVAAPAFAAGPDGDWAGSIDSPNGPVTINYTFKADGAKLTGTTTGPDGSKLALKDGKIDGANISFAVDVDFGGGPATLKYTGVVAADSIALTLDFQGMPVSITAKRVAAK
jgi:hypothetical protein